MRCMRSDGRIVDEVGEREDVSIGQVAGFPTADQYRAAAARAIEQAERIEQRNQHNEARRPRQG